MLGECLEIFGGYTEEEREKNILDGYIPKDGSYLLVGKNGEIISSTDIRLDKDTGEVSKNSPRYQDFCYFDYHSDLISMNKPQEPKKVIHSNNYLSFWIKKESLSNGKLTREVIDGYYDILEHPERKYDKYAMPLYREFEKKFGEVDTDAVHKNMVWIQEHIFSIREMRPDIDWDKKEYLKIFFEADRADYKREGDRYFIPNIYNKNIYNVTIEGEIFGLPDNNQGMNDKKPFLSGKTRKNVAPYLLNQEMVMLQKQFFDYLMNFAAVRKCNIYVDMDKKQFVPCKNDGYPEEPVSGFYLRIKKGKEVEIHDQDVVLFFENRLKKPCVYKNMLGLEDDNNPRYEGDIRCDTRRELEELIDSTLFSKKLIDNYFSKEEDIKIPDAVIKRMLLLSRRNLFRWFHLGNAAGIKAMLDRISMELIKKSIADKNTLKAAKQLNMRWSLMRYLDEGGNDMADFSVNMREGLRDKLLSEKIQGLENDREYYFAVGQMAGYLIFLSKAGKKKQSLINPFLNARTNEKLKELLGKYYKKYNYDIPLGLKRVNRLYGMVECYEPDGPVQQDMISAGFVMDNLLLEKQDKDTDMDKDLTKKEENEDE